MRIHRQGKINDVKSEVLATMPAVRKVDSTVALIHALIPLGLQSVVEALDAEVTALARERYRRTGGQPWPGAMEPPAGLCVSCGSETAGYLHASAGFTSPSGSAASDLRALTGHADGKCQPGRQSAVWPELS